MLTIFLPFLLLALPANLLLTSSLGLGLVGVLAGLGWQLRKKWRPARRPASATRLQPGLQQLRLGQHVSFLHKATMLTTLNKVPANTTVEIDGTLSAFIDPDVLSVIELFRERARPRNIRLLLLRRAADYARHLADQPRLSFREQEFTAFYPLFAQRNWVANKLQQLADYPPAVPAVPPRFLFVGFSEAPVAGVAGPGVEPRQVFGPRSAANVVVSTELSLPAVLRYAVEELQVEHIVLCGHYEGQPAAAPAASVEAAGRSWLTAVRESPAPTVTGEPETDQERHARLVRLHIIGQLYALRQSWAGRGDVPQLHGWVYDRTGGVLHDLGVDLRRDFSEYEMQLRYQLTPEGLRPLPGELQQEPFLYAVQTDTRSGPVLAIPPLDSHGPLGVP
ncbi:carbonic anhydrase [Hymenobacter guriensis]|uniref:carbonic anhydrase n=1 Tax=Hymenobacter guriensis TaxID=2793065 RepID=A0ABS0L137_9BACT|nr:carbonic anhydrase [Hymenobacter guriensis]MBG8553827.1 hypothetical protein [Hymenobacter guriensis]